MMNERDSCASSSDDMQLFGAMRSLSDWADLGPATDAVIRRSMDSVCVYGVRLMNLQASRRFLTVRIDDEHRLGRPTAELERELESKRSETRSFLEYLETHARVRP